MNRGTRARAVACGVLLMLAGSLVAIVGWLFGWTSVLLVFTGSVVMNLVVPFGLQRQCGRILLSLGYPERGRSLVGAVGFAAIAAWVFAYAWRGAPEPIERWAMGALCGLAAIRVHDDGMSMNRRCPESEIR